MYFSKTCHVLRWIEYLYLSFVVKFIYKDLFIFIQNILFTTRNNRAVCNSRRLPCKGKIISRPSTLSEQHS